MAKFRILSLDGGGSWALLQVMALQALYSENARGQEILKDFDLVAANSGGSITLGGLIENFTLRDLLTKFFLDQQKRNQIFTPIPFRESLEDKIYALVGAAPRYQTAAKLTALQNSLTTFGSCPMSELPPRIAHSAGRSPHFLITAFDYDWKRAVYFRSNRKSRAASSFSSADPALAEAIHASSTAPVQFFDSPAEFGGRRYWDGGVAGLNNPLLAAVIEALAGGTAPADIVALSIGTGSVRLPVAGPGVEGDPKLIQPLIDGASIPGNLRALAGAIVDDPPDAATFEAYVALGLPLPDPSRPEPVSSDRLVRVSPMIEPVLGADGVWTSPAGLGLDDFAAIAQVEMDAIKPEEVNRIRNLGIEWLRDRIPNQPIRANSKTLGCEIGHAHFSQARDAWNRAKAPAAGV